MAKTIRDEDLILNIIVKGEKGISGIDKVTASTARLNMTMNELSKHIKLTKTALANAVPGTENWKRLNQELKESKTRMKELQDQSKATGGALENLSKLKAGTVAAFAAMAGTIRGVSKAIGTIADFEQANANLSTIIGKNVDDIGMLTESAKQLGATTEYTASQVTFLQTELAKLGFKENDITKMQEPVLHFATAVGADLSEAASLAGATLRMFGLETSQTEDTLGVLTKATTNSALSFSYLQTAMSIVGPVAKTFGFSVRDTTALLGTLANSGFDASSAATATRNILLNLADANGKLATALGGPVKTLPELVEGLKTLDAQGVDLATTLELTDKRSVSAFNSFLHGADDVDTLRESLEDVKGVLGDTAEARMDTVQGSIKLLQSAWEGFILSLSGSTGVIKWVIDQATKIVSKLTEFVQGPGAILLRQARENGNIDYSSSDYFKGMGEDELQKVKKTYEQELATAEAELERLEGKSGFRKFFDNALKAEIDEAKAAVEFQKTRLASFNNFLSSPPPPPPNGPGGPGGPPPPTPPSNNGSKAWSLQSDPSFLLALAALRKQFNEGEIESQEEYEKRLYDLEVSALTARLALNIDKGADRTKLEADLQAKIFEQKKKELKTEADLAKEGLSIIASSESNKTRAALLEEDTRFKAEVKKFQETELLYENKTEVIEAIYRKHRNNLLKIQSEMIDRELSQDKQRHDFDVEQIKNKYSGLISLNPLNSGMASSLTKEMNAKIAESDLNYLEKLRNALTKITNDKGVDGVFFDDETLAKYNLQLSQTVTKINQLATFLAKYNAGPFSGTENGGSFLGVKQDEWEELKENCKNGKLLAEDLEHAITAIGEAANMSFQLASKAIANTNAKEQNAFKEYQKIQEKEKKALKNRLDSGLMSQAQYDAEIERMNAEAEAKEEAMKLKQAKREKSLNIVQSIINTALGVTKTLAQWGIPAGIAPAAIMSAMGAAQTALIAAQPVTGKEEGGFVNTRREQDGKRFKARLSPDKRGFIASPTVLVGENGGEYVIPAAGLDNPTLRPLLATIETARQAGRLKDLNFEAVYPLSSPIGREFGGYVRPLPTESVPNVATSAASRDSARLSEAIETLVQRLSRPIKADVSMTGRNGIIEKTEEYNRAKKRGQYNG